jgi:hypothetical protein
MWYVWALVKSQSQDCGGFPDMFARIETGAADGSGHDSPLRGPA